MSVGDSQNLPHYTIIETNVLYGSEVNVMTVQKAYKFRIYPNKKQIELINKTIGCSRFVFNFFLAKQKAKDAYWHICEEMVQNGQLQKNNW
jgi:putative transposase